MSADGDAASHGLREQALQRVGRQRAQHGEALHRPTDGAPVVIDERTEREFAVSALEGAINIALARLPATIRRVVDDFDTPLVPYCASGARSGMACTMLARMGCANVGNAGALFAAAARLQAALR